MQHYICERCGMTFDERDSGSYTEYYGEGVMRGPVHYRCCPKCGCDDLFEAEECCVCGDYFAAETDMIYVEDAWYCKACAEKVAVEFVRSWGITDDIRAQEESREARLAKIRKR